MVSEVCTYSETVSVSFYQAYIHIASAVRQIYAFLGVSIFVEYHETYVADQVFIRIKCFSVHLSCIQPDADTYCFIRLFQFRIATGKR